MRIALLADYYPGYLEKFQVSNALHLASLDFTGHREFLFQDYFGSFISYRNHFRLIGHEAELFVANYYPLQQKWLDERNSGAKASPRTKMEVVLDQLREYQPDLLFVGSMFDYYGEFFKEFTAISRNIFTWIACPMPPKLDFSHVRCVLSSVKSYVERFRSMGLNSEWLRAAFDPDILPRLGDVRKDIAVSFVGGLSPGSHSSRIATLEHIVRAGVPLQIWGDWSFAGRKEAVKGLFFRSPLRKIARPAVWGLEMYRTLARSRLTVNAHIDIAKATNTGGNMRLYEATGCGAMLVTDDAPDLGQAFNVGREVIAYSSSSQLVERIEYYSANQRERDAVASAGQIRCLKEHSYEQRITEFENILRSYRL